MSTIVYTVRGVDVSASVETASVRITNTGFRGLATASFRVRDMAATIVIEPEDTVTITVDGVREFGGLVRDRVRTIIGPNVARAYDVTCQDFTSLLSDDVIDTGGNRGSSETDKVRITALLAAFGSKGITVGAEVQSTATLDPANCNGLDLFEAIDAICQETGCSFYVNQNKVLHYFLTETTDAPFDFSDAPNGTTTHAYSDLRLPDESTGLVNAVWCIGAGVKGWRTNASSITTYGRREDVLRIPKIKTMAALNRHGDAYLAKHAIPLMSGSFNTYAGSGLRAGQRFNLTNNLWGLIAVTFRCQEVVTTVYAPQGRLVYRVTFGSGRPTLGRSAGQTSATTDAGNADAVDVLNRLVDLSLAGANLVPNSSAESAGDWTAGSWTVGQAVADAYQGLATFRSTPAATAVTALQSPAFIAVDRTSDYWLSVWSFLRAYTSGTGRIQLLEYDAGGTLLATTIIASLAAADANWTRYSGHFGPTDDGSGVWVWNAATAKVKIAVDSAAAATWTWDLDAFQFERSPLLTGYLPNPYELADGAVTTVKITDGAILAPKIGAGQVTAGKLAAASVVAGNVAAGAIMVGNLAGVARNLVTDPGFEYGVSAANGGWSGSGGRSQAVTAHGGGWSLLINGLIQQYSVSALAGCTGGRRYYFSGYARGVSTNTNAFTQGVYANWYDVTGAQIGAGVLIASGATGKTNAWTQYRGFAVAPTTAAFVAFVFSHTGSGATAAGYYDEAEITQADEDVSHAGGNVVIDSTGIHIINGALVVASDAGGTVIIDGTSDMFRIALRGTLVVAKNTGIGLQTRTVTVSTGLSYDPIVVWSHNPTAYNSGAYKRSLMDADIGKAGQVLNQYTGRANAAGGGNTSLQGGIFTTHPPVGPVTYKWHVLELAAI